MIMSSYCFYELTVNARFILIKLGYILGSSPSGYYDDILYWLFKEVSASIFLQLVLPFAFFFATLLCFFTILLYCAKLAAASKGLLSFIWLDSKCVEMTTIGVYALKLFLFKSKKNNIRDKYYIFSMISFYFPQFYFLPNFHVCRWES